jgi:hypothetical protein
LKPSGQALSEEEADALAVFREVNQTFEMFLNDKGYLTAFELTKGDDLTPI